MSALLTRRRFAAGAGAAGLTLAVGCGRLPWQGASPTRIPRLGYLASDIWLSEYEAAFRQGLQDRGYIDGQNIVIERRISDGSAPAYTEQAAELVNLPVDVIMATGGPATRAAKATTTNIPIVMLASSDPVGNGIVSSLARPGGNVTGLSLLSSPLSAKRLQLLTQAVPGLSRVAALQEPILGNSDAELRATQQAAETLGVELHPVLVRGPEQLESTFADLQRQGIEGLVVFTHGLAQVARGQIGTLAAQHRLATMMGMRELVESGGLMSYGPSFSGTFHRAAYYVDRILKGASPADLPIEQPTTFEFAVNLKTARELGITFPNEISLQVTEVIDG